MKTSIRETAIPKAEAGDRQLAVSLRRVESLQEVFDLAKQKAGVKIPKTPGDPEKWDDDLVTGRSRELEERLEAYHKVLNKHLLEWRRTGDDFDEQRFVNQLATNSNYLEHYREAVRNMPKTDKRHEQMVQMRNMLSGINNAYTYRYMQQNFENAVARGLDGSGQPNFDGRIPVIHTKDGGLRKQGNDIIYYPDGSTATITVNRQGIEVVQPRVDAAGQYIESQAPVSFAREQIEEAKQMKRQAQAWARGVVSRINTTSFTTKQLENEYEKITTQLLLKPTDANRVRAEAYASATFRRAEAELARERAKAEKTKKKIIARAAGSWALGSMIGFEGGAINRIPPYVEDQEKRRIVNVYEYRTRYHAITPGAKQKPGSPYLGPDGEVIVPLDKRNSGRWIYYPDGSRVLRNR